MLTRELEPDDRSPRVPRHEDPLAVVRLPEVVGHLLGVLHHAIVCDRLRERLAVLIEGGLACAPLVPLHHGEMILQSRL
jgi:hypothetical protein